MNAVGLIIYSAADVPKTKSFFATLLGGEPYVESPNYVGFRSGDVEVGVVPQAAQSAGPGALAYVTVTDIQAALAALLAAGAEKVQDVTDVANGLLVATVKNPDGTAVGLRQFPQT